ncbi:MAG: hypothetical protein NTY89_15415 [Nostocales cyanobacterium LacPavin_0920_SED1_MAG_38_18]|nr:hypothetical protein [Nostocales cyanobacterium LacPavin_0920_SED1_MAG_38_18]
MKKFQKNLLNLLFYVREYGIVETIIQFQNGVLIFEDFNRRFIQNCHLGFRKAQNCIVEEIINNQKEISQLEDSLKLYRRNKDKNKANDIQYQINIKKFEVKTYIKIADSIAWQLFYAQNYVARRLYSGRTSEVKLSESNIQHTLEEINNLHLKNPESIALISDITSFIDIGDIFFKNLENISVIELKQGSTNKVIQNILLDEQLTGISTETLIEKVKKEHGEKVSKQTQRMIKQGTRMKKLSDIINTGSGICNYLDIPIVIPEKPVKVKCYTDLLVKIVNELWIDNKKGIYEVVEGCIHIGVYNHSYVQYYTDVFGKLVSSKSGKNFPVFDYIRLCLDSPLAEPFFIKPFTKDQLIAMILKEIKIFIAIDFDEMINILNKTGLQADWISRSKTEDLKLNRKNEIFTFEHRAIQCKLNDVSVTMGKGLVSKMIFSHILPSSLAESLMQDGQQSEILEHLNLVSSLKYNLPTFVKSINLNIEPYL